jgi:hypothetical protein
MKNITPFPPLSIAMVKHLSSLNINVAIQIETTISKHFHGKVKRVETNPSRGMKQTKKTSISKQTVNKQSKSNWKKKSLERKKTQECAAA